MLERQRQKNILISRILARVKVVVLKIFLDAVDRDYYGYSTSKGLERCLEGVVYNEVKPEPVRVPPFSYF